MALWLVTLFNSFDYLKMVVPVLELWNSHVTPKFMKRLHLKYRSVMSTQSLCRSFISRITFGNLSAKVQLVTFMKFGKNQIFYQVNYRTVSLFFSYASHTMRRTFLIQTNVLKSRPVGAWVLKASSFLCKWTFGAAGSAAKRALWKREEMASEIGQGCFSLPPFLAWKMTTRRKIAKSANIGREGRGGEEGKR